MGEEINESGYGPRFSGEDYSIEGNVKTIRGTDIALNGEILYDQVPIAYLKEDFIKNHILQDGDLVMITTADCGLTGVFRKQKIHYIPRAYAVKLRLKKSSNPEYFKYLLQTTIADNQVNRFIRKATIGNLPGSDILKFEFNIPSLPEQTRIAYFFTVLDKKITELKQKKSLLEQYKKGVMQKIFSREFRFKDNKGIAFPKWEVKKLGDVLDYEQPTKYLVSSTEYNDSFETPVLTAGKTFILGYTNETNGIFKINLPVIIFDDFTTATKFVNFPFKAKSSAMKILLPKNGADIKFIYEIMQILNYEIGGHERHWISKFSQIEILIPCSSEQIKIANFLSAIDKKINYCNTQIKNTEQYKKGLLQKMFC